MLDDDEEGLDAYKNGKKCSLLLNDERANSLIECDHGQLVISLAETDLLIVKDWIPVKVIREKSIDNINKQYFTKLPGFDVNSFPFVICSGFKQISLINIKTMQIQSFIEASCNTSYGQQAFFFKLEKYGYTLHFGSKVRENLNFELHQWHSL